MLFNSLEYALFLPIVFIIYWLIPNRFRWILILGASYYFYMSWNPKYIVLIVGITVISYLAGLLVEREQRKTVKKAIVTLAALLCLATLLFFKYFNFLSGAVAGALQAVSIKVNPITLNLILPVGISFYTFQALSYVIDVYRGDAEAEHHFGYYAAFVSFFPQLVAGPIERTSNLLPQIKGEHKFDYDKATYGLKMMTWGFFKKIVIADCLSEYISGIYNTPGYFKGFSLLLATVFFSIQIYCDFSGYSDIAVGTAKLMGIDLMQNFKSPYFSKSIKEFWSRWHISLSTWFRDYLYIPLGGNRVGKVRHAINLIITFLVSGLWHGANWTFVLWGGIHGVMQVVEKYFCRKNKKSSVIGNILSTVIVFALCSFAWIFFVSSSLSDSFYVIRYMLSGIKHPVRYISTGFEDMGLTVKAFVGVLIPLIVLSMYDFFSLKEDVIRLLSSKKLAVRWIVYVVMVLWILLSISATNTSEFIYFQF